jgi:hypothetical protein
MDIVERFYTRDSLVFVVMASSVPAETGRDFGGWLMLEPRRRASGEVVLPESSSCRHVFTAQRGSG